MQSQNISKVERSCNSSEGSTSTSVIKGLAQVPLKHYKNVFDVSPKELLPILQAKRPQTLTPLGQTAALTYSLCRRQLHMPAIRRDVR